MALERSIVSDINSAIEGLISPQTTETNMPSQKPLIETLIFSDPEDPRRENLTKEERIRLYNAQTMASEDYEELKPRLRPSEWNPDDSSQDWISADPLSDPEVSRLASLIIASKVVKKG